MNVHGLLDVLFPPQCGGCEEPATGLCEQCLPRAVPVVVRLRTLEVRSLGAYEGRLRRAIVALKSGRRDVARAFADRLRTIVARGSELVPVPTTAARRRERGFDGCALMAQLMHAHREDIRVCPGLVQTRGDRQRGRDREARLSATGRFAWRGGDVQDRTLVLLDDVATTGATLEDCAATLRGAGARVEQAIVIARA